MGQTPSTGFGTKVNTPSGTAKVGQVSPGSVCSVCPRQPLLGVPKLSRLPIFPSSLGPGCAWCVCVCTCGVRAHFLLEYLCLCLYVSQSMSPIP